MDPASFIKLKALKVIPTDTGSPNIMRLYFPRNKNTEKAIKIDVKSDSDKTSEPTKLPSVNQFSEKELKTDFIEVDDILLVRDPKKIDEVLKSQQIVEVTSAPAALQTTESTKSTDNKPDKKNLEELFNQSERYRKLVRLFNANKSDSFNKSLKDRGLFKREGNPDKPLKDIPDATDKDPKPEDVSRNSDFDIVSSPSSTTEVPAVQTTENATEKVEQIQTTTETSVEKSTTEEAEKSTEASKSVSADGEMVGVSLKELQADEKNLEIDQKIIEEETKTVQQDEQRVKDDEEKKSNDQLTLDMDKMNFGEDKDKFSADLKLNDETTKQPTMSFDDDDTVGISLVDLQADSKNLEQDRTKIANDTKRVQEDDQQLNVDKGIRDMDKALLDMSKSIFEADKAKFLADLESSDTTDAPMNISSQVETEKPVKTQTEAPKATEAPKTPKVKHFFTNFSIFNSYNLFNFYLLFYFLLAKNGKK